MSVPRDRVSFGAHVFPFVGLRGVSVPPADVPFLPLRLRLPAGRWCLPFNAVLDTGSTHTVLPFALAEDLGLPSEGGTSTMEGAAADFETTIARCDLAIADAGFPDVNCWEINGLEIRVGAREARIRRPVIGWDVLGLFDLALSQARDRIELRLAANRAP